MQPRSAEAKRVSRPSLANPASSRLNGCLLSATTRSRVRLERRFPEQRQVSRVRRRALKRVAQWCRLHRHHPIEEQQQTLAQKLRGHFGYYGITGTSKRSNTSANRSCASG